MKRCTRCGCIAFDNEHACRECGGGHFAQIADDKLTLRDGIRCVASIDKNAPYTEKMCLTYLMDIVPGLQQERIMLGTAFQCGAIEALRNASGNDTGDAMMLMKSAGMTDSAIDVVLQAYGFTPPVRTPPKPATPPKPVTPPRPVTPPVTPRQTPPPPRRQPVTPTPVQPPVQTPPPPPPQPTSKPSYAGWLVAVAALVAVAFLLFKPSTPRTDTTSTSTAADTAATSDAEEYSMVTPEEYAPEPEPEPELTQTAPPVFDDADASSTLKPDQVTSYYGPLNAIDNNIRTAWNEGADGDGIGEWIRLLASSPQVVRGVTIVGGYPKTEDIYYKNNRPCDVTITLTDGYSTSVTLNDDLGSYQTVTFDGLHRTSSITFTVDSVYHGSTWSDTSFAEVSAF